MSLQTFNNQTINQFAPAPTLGQLDLRLNIQTLAVQLDPNYTPGQVVVPGTPMKIVAASGVGGTPIVTPCTAATDNVFCFINYDPKLNQWPPGAIMSASFFRGNVMYMLSAGAIDRYTPVEIVVNTNQVQQAVNPNIVVGFTIDQAAAANALIRVAIDLPGYVFPA